MTTVAETKPAKLFTRNFWLISLASTALFTSMHMLTPSMPLYLEQHAHALWTDMGIILAAFITTSLVLRPFVGYWCDKYGHKPWMILGAVLFILMPLVYPYTLATPAFIVVRILHGLGFGCFMTAASAYLTMEVPTDRRAEGLSHYSNAIKIAMAFGPYLGLYLAKRGEFDLLFFLASGASLLTLLFTLPITPAQSQQDVAPSSDPKPFSLKNLLQPAAIYPGLVMTTNSIVFGTLIPFTPLIAKEKGFLSGEIDMFYVVYALSLIFSRGLTGPISDKLGRRQVVVPGMLGVTLTLLLLAQASHPTFFLVSAALYGLCAGTVQPSLMAMVADRVPANQRGSGMATFTLLNDLGIALGTFITGHFGPEWGYIPTLYLIIGFTAVGLCGFLFYPLLNPAERAQLKEGGQPLAS